MILGRHQMLHKMAEILGTIENYIVRHLLRFDLLQKFFTNTKQIDGITTKTMVKQSHWVRKESKRSGTACF